MNSEKIISRLKKVLEHYSLTSSTFADTIDVQRSSISHLMSGRNKPSLDFVLKIIDKFPEVDLYWLLNGKGSFPKKEEIIEMPKKETIPVVENEAPSLFSPQPQNEPIEKVVIKPTPISVPVENNGKKLVKVILFYDDGSLEDFNK